MRAILSALLIFTGLPVSAEIIVSCPAGRWEGYTVGYDGNDSWDGSNGITYPSIRMSIPETRELGDLVPIEFGSNAFGGSDNSAIGYIGHSQNVMNNYVVVHSVSKQIEETLMVDIETGRAILSEQKVALGNVYVNAFKGRCEVS